MVAPLSRVTLGLKEQQVLLSLAHGRITRTVASLALGNDAVGRELPVVSRRGNSIFFDGVGLKHVDQLTRGKAFALQNARYSNPFPKGMEYVLPTSREPANNDDRSDFLNVIHRHVALRLGLRKVEIVRAQPFLLELGKDVLPRI